MRSWLVLLAAACSGNHASEAAPPAKAPVPAATPAPRVPVDTSPLPDGARRRLGGTSLRHAEALETLAVSADGTWLATGAADDTLKLWDAATGAQRYLSDTHGFMDRISATVFVGDAVVFAKGAGGITVTSTRDFSERELTTCGKAWVEGIAASPDGKTLAVVCEGIPQVRLQPIDGGAYQAFGRFDAKFGAIAWSADGAYLALTTVRDNKLHVIDVQTKREVAAPKLREHPHVLAFAPKGAVLAYDDTEHYTHEHVALYDVAARKELASYPLHVSADAIAFSRDGSRLAFGQATGNRAVIVIDLATGARHELVRPTLTVRALAFADAEGKRLWIGHDHGARLWDVASDRELLGPAGHVGEITALAFRPDGKTLASGSSDRTIRLWDVATGASRVLQVISDDYGVIFVSSDDDYQKFSLSLITGLGWSPDGSRLYDTDGRIGTGLLRSWNVERGVQLHARGQQTIGVKAFALAKDGKRAFALGTEEGLAVTLRIVDPDTGRELHRVEDLDTGAVAVSPDGTRVAVTDDDKVLVLDAATGAKQRALPASNVTALAFSPDGKRLAIGGTSEASVVDVATGSEVASVYAGTYVHALAFAPDGRLIVGTYHGDVIVSALGAKAEPVTHEHAHRGIVQAIAVAPDGKSFATGAVDGEILVWPL